MCLDVIKRRKTLRISCLRVDRLLTFERFCVGAAFVQVLQFATTRSSLACQQLLEAFGLKTIFAFFMKKMSVTNKKAEMSLLYPGSRGFCGSGRGGGAEGRGDGANRCLQPL